MGVVVFIIFIWIIVSLIRRDIRQAKAQEENRNRIQHAKESYARLQPKINSFDASFSALRNHHFISHSEVVHFKREYKSLIEELNTIEPDLSVNEKKQCSSIIYNFNTLESNVPLWNDIFVSEETIVCSDLLDDIDGKSLDDQQREVVVSDEDHNLIIAGAGSGKTLTIQGKVKYLVEVKKVNPEDILLIAFAKKAAGEMTNRIQAMGINAEAVTFHKLGLDIISKAKGKRPDVYDESSFRRFIEDYFRNTLLDQPQIMKSLIEYFAYYLHIPADINKFRRIGEAFEHEKNDDYQTIRSKYIDGKIESYGKEKRTLQGEFVKSREELAIANFFFLHGINYEYERQYPFDTGDQFHKQYRPDFYLPDYDIYLEHFGVNKNGKLPWLSPIEEQKYLDGMRWKRNLHRTNNTRLIETYSWYNSEGILLTKLAELLNENGVRLVEADYLDIYQKVYDDAGDRCFHEFIQLCSTFITLHKSNGYSIDDLDKLSYQSPEYNSDFHIHRAKLFKSIIRPILNAYQLELEKTDEVDFSDMIIEATAAVMNGCSIHKYKYVIIDEYQDISVARYKLVKAILDKTGAHLMCVGDDWQSIYRFSGSDLGLFTQFEKSFGYSKIMRIEKTYRNSQELINIASNFITKNPNQLQKSLKSDKQLATPVNFFYYQESPASMLSKILLGIVKKYGVETTVLILGRTHHDEEELLETGLFNKTRKNGIEQLTFLKVPELKVSFMTVHKSKGLEADNVIIMNFNNALLGFPNKIADDPLLEMQLSSSDTFLYGEERRLLYVALTRTKNLVSLLIDVNSPSEFVRDFENEPQVKRYCQSGIGTLPVKCPKCSTGHLTVRSDQQGGSFAGCTNYPKCDYKVNDISVLSNPIICRRCGGFMLKRRGPRGNFLGCSNYPKCMNTVELDSNGRTKRS